MTRIVLVHGAWHGAWCWDGVLAELRDRKIDAVAVELPFTGFEDDVDVVRSAIGSASEGVVVCAHSYGGAVVSQAVMQLHECRSPRLPGGIRQRRRRFRPDRPSDHAPRRHRAGRRAVLHRPAVSPSRSSTATASPRPSPPLRPASVLWFWTPPPSSQTPAAPRTAPSTYVVCSRDGAIPPEAQYQMAQGLDRVVVWPTDHSPFLTRPADVADLLERTLDAAHL